MPFSLRMKQVRKNYLFTGKQATCKIPQWFFEVKEQGLRKHRVCLTGDKITTKSGWYIDQLNIWVTTEGI